MKTVTYLVIMFLALQFNAFAETFRRTSSDIYVESYSSQMKNHLANFPTQYRADEYRARYEICDSHHECVNETARGVLSPSGNEKIQKHEQPATHFLTPPMVQ